MVCVFLKEVGEGFGELRRPKRVAIEEALVTLEMAKNLAATTLHLEVSGRAKRVQRELGYSDKIALAHPLAHSASSARRFAPRTLEFGSSNVTFGSIGHVR